ncbi:MAG: tRNA (adenosine(37)-N6)-threonylcarbamoyltransferase complex dimerization subunit type 1 TsaB [Clostridiales bacterium]|jgi:tRNA threonylcarbamoyladenosine biosynthesis protein TsaB|nr:tRNA (adenosine(37)-N6)-threonylcarbamoyltransferase complex dimerization subunit type 1 TsaB [Clostridiales bacterium]
MKILALDSSGLVASVAIASEDVIMAEYTVNYKKTHSQTLLPMLDEIVRMVNLDLAEVDAIAVTAGPGSFTGLRIGSATAKGLGLALNKPVIPVPTIDCLAYNLYGTDKLICPIMDARRNQVYTGLYEFEGGDFVVVSPQKAVSMDEIIDEINGIGKEAIFLGDAVPIQKDRIAERIKVNYSFAPLHLNRQRAGAAAALGIMKYKAGQFETAAEHQPVYLRVSQAERERTKKTLLIRDMTVNDVDEVYGIEKETFSEPWSRASFTESLSDPNNTYLVAEADDKIVGYCGFWGIAGEGHICNVAVRQEYRNREIGYTMLKELIARAKSKGIASMTLEVRSSNQPAINLYKKLGFTEAGTRKNFYAKPVEDAIIMWLAPIQ